MTAKATEDILAQLHGELANKMLDILQLPEADCTPSHLNAIRQFLKDNDISCDPVNNNTIQDIVANLPTNEELDNITIGGDDHMYTQ